MALLGLLLSVMGQPCKAGLKPAAPEEIPAESPTAASFTAETPPAQAEPPVMPTEVPAVAVFPHEDSDLVVDPSVTWGHLPNGFRYALIPATEPPGRVSMRLFVGVGSLMETDSQRGIAHFLEHMAFNGSEHYPPGSLVEYLQRMGMGFGADTNAYTSFSETVYMLELPGNSPELVAEGLKVFRDYAGGLLLLEDEVQRERGVVLNELRQRDTVDYRRTVASWEFMLPDALLPRRFPIGTRENIEAFTADHFKAFYKTWYRPSRMALAVAGDVSHESLKGWISEAFSTLEEPSAAAPVMPIGSIKPVAFAASLHPSPESPSTEMMLMSIRPWTRGKDRRELRLADIRAAAVNGILTRRLERLSKSAVSPISAGSASSWDYLKFMEVASLDVTCKPSQWKDALWLMEHELRRTLLHGFTEAELQEVKAYAINKAEEALLSSATQTCREKASALQQTFSEDTVFLSPETRLELVRAALGSDFGTEQALQVFRSLWEAPDRRLFVTGNLELENAAQVLQTEFELAGRFPVEAPLAEKPLVWAYATVPKTDEKQAAAPLARVSSEALIEDLGIHQAILPNGIRLNFKKTDFESNTVRVQFRFGEGRLSMDETQHGLDWLASLAFIEGGLGAHSFDELKSIMAAHSVEIALEVADNAFVLKGKTSPRDFVFQMELLAAYLKDPGYRKEAHDLALKRITEIYESIRRTPEGVFNSRVERFLSGGNFRFGAPAVKVFEELTLEDLRLWMNVPLTTSYLEVSVIGSVEWSTVRETSLQVLGSLETRRDAPRALGSRRVARFPREVSEIQFDVDSSIPKAAAYVFWPTDDFWDISRTRRLNLLSQILDDRLRVKVREELGEGYSPTAYSVPSEAYPDFGYLFATNSTAPEKAREMTHMMESIAEELIQRPISDDELQRSREPVLNYIRELLRSNSYWMRRVLGQCQEKPEVLQWARTIETEYASITAAELHETAKSYLAPGNSLRLIVAPEAPLPKADAP